MGQWLPRDLESIAGGEVGLWGETAPELSEWGEGIIPGEALEVLKHGARRRWEAKLSMAAGLLEAHGWEGALHRMVLYYLGYPINRLPFWEMADTFPPELWGDSLIPFLKEGWWHHVQWSAGRPGARAEARLISYARLPHGWMDALQSIMQRHFAASAHVSDQAEPGDAGTILEVRRRLGLGIFQAHLIQFVLGAAFSTDMAQRLLLDVFLPLCAASGVTSPALGYLIWFNARPGHYPTGHAALLQTIGLCDGRSRPIANGLLQGLYRVDDDLRLERLRADRACTAIDVGG
jgi:hypothetical protein